MESADLSGIEVAATLYCQHPTVCELQKLKDRIVWLASHSKPECRRPFKPQSQTAKALRSSKLVTPFESSGSNPLKLNKDQKHYALLYAWQHDCLGRLDYDKDEARRLVQEQGKQQAAEVERLRAEAEAKKIAHAKALERLKQPPSPRPRRKAAGKRTFPDSDDESDDEAATENKMLMAAMSMLEAKMPSSQAGPLWKRLRRLTGNK